MLLQQPDNTKDPSKKGQAVHQLPSRSDIPANDQITSFFARVVATRYRERFRNGRLQAVCVSEIRIGNKHEKNSGVQSVHLIRN